MIDLDLEVQCVSKGGTFAWESRQRNGYATLTGIHQDDKGTALVKVDGGKNKIVPEPLSPFDAGHIPIITKAGSVTEGDEGEPYKRPHVWFRFTLDTRFIGYRYGLLDFNFVCQTDGNYLFSDKGWEVEMEPGPYLVFVGKSIMRLNSDNAGNSNSLGLRVFQSIVVNNYVPTLSVRIKPTFTAYADDPPNPPEPRWWGKAMCTFLLNDLRLMPIASVHRDMHIRELSRQYDIEEETENAGSPVASDISFEFLNEEPHDD